MNCPCGKFCDGSFSRFGSIVQTDKQTHKHTDTNERFTLIGVSKNVMHSPFTSYSNCKMEFLYGATERVFVRMPGRMAPMPHKVSA